MCSLSCLSACSSDPPPSCQQALTHYYSAGCAYTDLNTNTPIAEGDMINRCLQAASSTPSQCSSALDAWLSCNDAVPSPATNNAQCDCSQTYMTYLTCH